MTKRVELFNLTWQSDRHHNFISFYRTFVYRDKMKPSESEIQTFTFGQDLVFDAFIQFKEYIGFVKAMNSLKGMKLLCKDRYEDRAWVANIKVN